MLTELRIKNLALIESAEISFGPGFNALTGETGAGKSILLGAITLLLGGRASIDDIRTGEDMAFVEGVFEIAKVKSARELMARHGIPPEGDRLIVRREISRQGRNRIFLNASASPLSVLMAFGDVLIDVHGQHDHQSLLRPESHMETLDSFRDVEPVRKAYDEQYRIWNEAEATLRELLAKEKELLERKEFLLFRVEEIGKAAVRLDEDRQLEEELRILESAGKRFDLSAGIADRLVESESAVQSVLAECRKNAEALARIDPAAAVAAKGLESALIETGEAARFFSAYSRAVEHKPDRIEEIQERLSLLGRFKKKYGPSLEEVLSTYEKARIDLDRIENLDAHKAGLLSAAAREKKALSKAGREDVEVFSCGISAFNGLMPTPETLELLAKEGVSMPDKRTRRLDKTLLKSSDIILAMEKHHEERILDFVPEVKTRVFLLKEFVKISDESLEIGDPIGQGSDFYEKTFYAIKEAVNRIVDLI